MVPTAQPLGDLAVYLLEPRSEDGLATWNFFDAELTVGGDFPVLRLPRAGRRSRSRRLSRSPNTAGRCGRSPSTWAAAAGGGRRGGFGGQTRWLDGRHWLAVARRPAAQVRRRDRPRAAVHRCQGAGGRALAPGLARRRHRAVDRRRHDLRHGPAETRLPVRARPRPLLRDVRRHDGGPPDQRPPGASSSPSSAPTASRSRSCATYDLYAVDIATQTERRLTTGGRDDLRHGHADWVYYEEIFNRRWPAFWWSPDSKQLAFMEFDDAGVPYHTVLDDSFSPSEGRKDPLSALGRAQPQGPPGGRRPRRRLRVHGPISPTIRQTRS